MPVWTVVLAALAALAAASVSVLTARRRPKTRMTEGEAQAAAQAAFGADWPAEPPSAFNTLSLMGVERVDGRILWSFRTATVGSWLEAVVDDATGEVIEARRRGVR